MGNIALFLIDKKNAAWWTTANKKEPLLTTKLFYIFSFPMFLSLEVKNILLVVFYTNFLVFTASILS